MNEITIIMKMSRATKNTVVYVPAEETESPLIPALYLSKSGLPIVPPKEIEVTVK